MIPWIGGKYHQSKWINPFIPKNIDTYIEPFGGAFWNYLKNTINIEEKKVIYNDFNPILVNMFMCMKYPDKMLSFLEKEIPFDEESFVKHRSFVLKFYDKKIKLNEKNPNFDLATSFIYVMTHIFSGVGIKPNSTMCYPIKREKIKNGETFNKNAGKFNSIKNKLRNKTYTEKLKKIDKFENKDFSEIIRKYDSENTFFYLDPPYFSKEHFYANHEFDLKDHERLKNELKLIKGKFLISYYYFDDLEKMYPKDQFYWAKKDYSVLSGARKNKSQKVKTEILIANYDLNSMNKKIILDEW